MACSGGGLTVRAVFLGFLLSGQGVLSLRKDNATEYLDREDASDLTGICKPWSQPPCKGCWTRVTEWACKQGVKAVEKVVPAVVNTANFLKPCTPYTDPPCHKCWTTAGENVCKAGRYALDHACVPWTDPPCTDCISGAVGKAACETQHCFPWHNPPCHKCLTNVGQSACQKTLDEWNDKVMRFYKETLIPFTEESHYFDGKFGTDEHEQWLKNAVCKIGFHTGIFTLGKVGCYVATGSLGASICTAIGVTTAVETMGVVTVVALPACVTILGGVMNLVCGVLATAFQEKVIYNNGGATATCDVMGFTNPIPEKYRKTSLLED